LVFFTKAQLCKIKQTVDDIKFTFNAVINELANVIIAVRDEERRRFRDR